MRELLEVGHGSTSSRGFGKYTPPWARRHGEAGLTAGTGGGTPSPNGAGKEGEERRIASASVGKGAPVGFMV